MNRQDEAVRWGASAAGGSPFVGDWRPASHSCCNCRAKDAKKKMGNLVAVGE